EIMKATGGELLCGDKTQRFEKVCIDSRSIVPNDLFVAIVGEIHDGHAFISDVVEQGARGLIVNSEKARDLPISAWQTRNIACVAVRDTTRALGDLAAFHRARTDVAVVAITGSNGKTTTRQMTAAVVARKFNTLSTTGNYNNQIGVPLTLLRLAPEHRWAVVELGSNSPGEIARLAQICSPDIGVITNVAPAHLEGLGSLDGVMREKGQLLDHLKAKGKAVLNTDDRRVSKIAARTKKDVLFFGLSEKAAIRATAVNEKASGISFSLDLPQESLTVDLKAAGHFMVVNALAAAAVGHLLGLPATEIKAGLETFEPAWGRMNILQTASGIHVIDDTYNANPESMKAAITTLVSLRANNRSVFVAGDMLELGTQAESLHRQVGVRAATANINKLLVTGDYADAVADGAKKAGMKSENIFTGSQGKILNALKDSLKPGDWVLVKGSRGAHMDTVVEGLKKWAGIDLSV
ncbi:MAG: UDP-N-acetylmuramoyl-tripeptide--D-alanyl-D-alanine ligase, partial [Desulfobacterales bacterium]|nr:UDP-N-acetylmuramoyl-tripeptide--D-alanyl-D-alanine ligase [Desulfobacterales bacterium]